MEVLDENMVESTSSNFTTTLLGAYEGFQHHVCDGIFRFKELFVQEPGLSSTSPYGPVIKLKLELETDEALPIREKNSSKMFSHFGQIYCLLASPDVFRRSTGKPSYIFKQQSEIISHW